MPLGIIVNFLCIIIGGSIGALFGKRVPKVISERLPIVFGLACLGMGIVNIIKLDNLTAVVLSIVIGTIIGELLFFEKGVVGIGKFIAKLTSGSKADDEEYMKKYLTIIIALVASATGIYGSLVEGFSGDSSILLSIAVLNFFSSMIFAINLGFSVPMIAIPQAILYLGLFYLSQFIMPYTNESMIADFSAVGGYIILANGLKMLDLKDLHSPSILPGFIIVMPLSHLLSLWM